MKFPTEHQVPSDLLNHFIRGYFDRDGCIHIDNSKTPSILFQLCGTYDVLNKIKNIFNISANIKNIGNVYELRCKGNKKALKIFDTLYSKSSIHLERKYNIYSQFKCRLESKSTEDLR